MKSIRLGLSLGVLALAALGASACGGHTPTDTASERVVPAAARGALLLAASAAGDVLLAVGEHGLILRSGDAGRSFEQVAVPRQGTLTDVHLSADGGEAWAIGHDELILHSADGGRSWDVQSENTEPDNPLLDLYFETPEVGYAVGGYGVIYSTRDGGRSWQRNVIRGGDGFEYHFYGITRGADGAHYLAAEQGRLMRSTDGAQTWERLESPYEGSYFGIQTTPGGALLAYGMLANAFRSEDGGASWQRVDIPAEQSLLGGATGADGSIWLTGRAGMLLHSRDDGRSFEAVQTRTRRVVTDVQPNTARGLLVTGEFGLRATPQEQPGALEPLAVLAAGEGA